MLVVLTAGLLSLMASGGEPLFFDTNDTGLPPADVPTIKPWKVVPLDPAYGGQWVVAADLNADGKVEFVACENHNVGDVHYTSTAVAHDLDGTVLWRWAIRTSGERNGITMSPARSMTGTATAKLKSFSPPKALSSNSTAGPVRRNAASDPRRCHRLHRLCRSRRPKAAHRYPCQGPLPQYLRLQLLRQATLACQGSGRLSNRPPASSD